MNIKAMRSTVNGAHTWHRWTNGTATLEQIVTRYAKLGTVKVKGTTLTVTRFDGTKIKAEVFPA